MTSKNKIEYTNYHRVLMGRLQVAYYNLYSELLRSSDREAECRYDMEMIHRHMDKIYATMSEVKA
jgi:hypothetical protein